MRRRVLHVWAATWSGICRPGERTRLKRFTWVASSPDRPVEWLHTDARATFHSHPYEVFRPWRCDR